MKIILLEYQRSRKKIGELYNTIFRNYRGLFGIKELYKIDKQFLQKNNNRDILILFKNKYPEFLSYNDQHLLKLFSFLETEDDLNNIDICLNCEQKVAINLAETIRFKKLTFFKRCNYHKNKDVALMALETYKKLHNGLNPSQNNDIKKKKGETLFKNYGVKNIMHSEELKSKVKETIKKNFGVNNPSQSSEIKKKKEKTSIKNYGVKCILQSDIIKDRIKKSCQIKYGVDNPSQIEEIKEKKKQTFLENYGIDNIFKTQKFKENLKQHNLDKYGVEFYSQTDKGRENSRKSAIEFVEQQKLNGEPLCPCIGVDERKCLDELEKLINFKILRNQRKFNYFIDGYIQELNISIEFDEPQHFDQNGNLLERDNIRQKDLQENLNCKFFRIKQKDWLQNKENILNNFKLFLGGILHENKKNTTLKW